MPKTKYTVRYMFKILIHESRKIGKMFCTMCEAVFSIEHEGRSGLKQHMEKNKITCRVSASKNDEITKVIWLHYSEKLKITTVKEMFAFQTLDMLKYKN